MRKVSPNAKLRDLNNPTIRLFEKDPNNAKYSKELLRKIAKDYFDCGGGGSCINFIVDRANHVAETCTITKVEVDPNYNEFNFQKDKIQNHIPVEYPLGLFFFIWFLQLELSLV